MDQDGDHEGCIELNAKKFGRSKDKCLMFEHSCKLYNAFPLIGLLS